jgi:SAM-dependent methyltransferase
MSNGPELHSNPLNDNILDKLSSRDRFQHFYRNFLASEQRLIEENITPIIRQGRVLNVGCGGNGTERGLFPASCYDIFGADLDEKSLRTLQTKRLYSALCKGDIISLPFVSDAFDIVYLRLVLHHLIYPRNILDEGLRECFRVLKHGGILAMVEPNSWHPIGALMNLTHRLGIDLSVHGTDDDVALSPSMMAERLSPHAAHVSTYAITYSWRRLPISVQRIVDRCHVSLEGISSRFPYLGHTLMMIARKRQHDRSQ